MPGVCKDAPEETPMAFEITPNVQVSRDRNGRIRQLSHAQQPYRLEAVDFALEAAVAPLTPRVLAEQYIRDVAEILELAPESLGNFAAEATLAPSPADTELRFKEEKTAAG